MQVSAHEAERIADAVEADLTRAINGDGLALLMRGVARAAVLRACGCTCGTHSDPGAVYAEDITCPLHGTVSIVIQSCPNCLNAEHGELPCRD